MDLSQLPPPPKGQTGINPSSLSQLPPPPAGQKGVSLADINKGLVPQKSLLQKASEIVPNAVFGAGKALTTSEQGLGQSLGDALALGSKDVKQAQQHQTQLDNMNVLLGHAIAVGKKTGKDTSRLEAIYKSNTGQPFNLADIAPSLNKSASQIYGEGLGTALDIASAGSYGEAASGAKFLPQAGDLLGASGELTKATPVVKAAVKLGLGDTLKKIGIGTAQKAATGAATGYGFDVSQNLQSGKTGSEALTPGAGTFMGAAVPIAIGGVQAGVAITKDTAPRFINSLIKPNKAGFSYGKDPGRTVSELGITGNNLNDFENNIRTQRQDIGSIIGATYEDPQIANLKIDASPEISKLDTAISEAAKGGKQNQAVVTALQDTKDAILYEHQVNADGVIEKVGTTPRDLTQLSPKEAFDLKQLVSGQTKFTGNPTDDKTVNSVLKDIYGGITTQLNNTVSPYSPEITDLNQKYADLTSAELAVKNRDMIVKRSNLVSMPIKAGATAALVSTIASGGAAIPAILTGIAVGTLDKALESTAVKTRIASWLGSAEPSIINKVLTQNPGLRTAFYRLVPKLGSRLGK